MTGEIPLHGGWQTDVSRRGDVVLRTPGPQSPVVIALLTHLRRNGFTAAPRPVDGGFAPDRRERSARDEAIVHQVAPPSPSPATDGFPLLWAITWRTRAAAWMLDHRRELETAVLG